MAIPDYVRLQRDLTGDIRGNERSLNNAKRKVEEGIALTTRVKGNFNTYKGELQSARRNYEAAMNDYKKLVDELAAKQREQAAAEAEEDQRKVRSLENQIKALDRQANTKFTRMASALDEVNDLYTWCESACTALNRVAQ